MASIYRVITLGLYYLVDLSRFGYTGPYITVVDHDSFVSRLSPQASMVYLFVY